MAKKSKALAICNQAVEVLPGRVDVGDRSLERMIEQKLAEMMGKSQDAIFQPFFQTKAIAHEIRKLQTVPQQHKWTYRFEDYGCLICHSKEVRHASLSMCQSCHSRTVNELKASMKRHEDAQRPEPTPVRDLQDVAREALRPTQKALPAETRPYVPKAERKTERKAQREAERQRGSARREKRAGRVETLRHAVEQGLTAKEIAEKYDPDFLKNPEAATQRIQVALYRYVPRPVRERRQHERIAHREEMLRQARHLHERGLTWREVTELLDPEGFATDPKAAMARIITGVRWVSQRVRFRAEFRNKKAG